MIPGVIAYSPKLSPQSSLRKSVYGTISTNGAL